ncbi:MAG: hypothetical protein KJO55_03425, partial [Gammaproteobacteria bacterium]|nr:hypothetical protein [Gammaproteobacteria bacterium]
MPLVAAAVILFTGPGLRLAWDMTRDLVPGKISAEHISGRLVGPIEITGLNWRQDQRQLRIDQARIEWQPRALLSRHLHINNLRASGVLWQDTTPASDSTNTEPFTLPRLPIQITADAVDIKTVRVEQADSEFVIDDIHLAGRTNDEAYELTFTAEAEQLETAGEARIELESPNALVLASDWHYLPPETDGISARLNLGGSLERLEIDLETDGELSATVGGTLTQLFEQPTFAGNVEVRNIAPRLSGLPDERVSGELTVNAQATDIAANGRIDIPALLPRPVIVNGALNMGEGFRLQPTTVSLADAPGTVTVSGDVDPATQRVDVELAWKQLQWPLVGKAQWRSTNGTGTLQGSFDDYRFSANGNIGNPTLPPLQIAARGTGNTGAVTLERLVATTTDSRERATASGRIGWQDTTSARLDVELVAIDIRRLHPDLRGEMSATTRVAVNLPASGAVVDVAIARLDGNLNGRPLDGKGAIRIEGEDIRVRELELRAGEARLLANGAVASDQVNLDWDLFVPELARLWPGFAGRIASRGRATGNRANPQLDGDIDASDIAVATVRIGELQGDFMTGLGTDSTVEIDVTAKNVAVGELVAGDIQLGIAGRASDHTIAIDLDGPHSELSTQLQGALADNDWQGRVQQLRFSHPQFEPLQLAAPAPLLVGPGRLETTALCLTQQTSSLCIDGAAATGSEDELQIQLTDLPLATFALLLPPGLEYDGVIDGDATLTLASGTPTGRAELRLEQGQVITREDGNPETLIA